MFREEATWAFFCHRKPPPLWRAGSRAHGPQWELEAAQHGSCWEAPVVRWEGRAQPRPPSVSSPARALADRGLGCVPAEPSALCTVHAPTCRTIFTNRIHGCPVTLDNPSLLTWVEAEAAFQRWPHLSTLASTTVQIHNASDKNVELAT